MLKIVYSAANVLPFLEAIVAASNRERNSFGFLPKTVYQEFAERDQIIIAIDTDTNHLVGYTIFAGALPVAKVRQTYVESSWRGKGVGEKLISELISQCEDRQYLSVKATVAADLLAANQFYEKHGFTEITRKPGGKSKNRSLIVRARELDTPSLLNFIQRASSNGPEIFLDVPTAGPAPQYLFDLNVIFDVIRRRHNEEALAVFSAAFENSVRLAISEEFVAELEATSQQYPTDPLLQLARALPVVKGPSGDQGALFEALAALVFPEHHRMKRLSDRDKADLRHLTTAIIENTAGFITSEKAMLRQSGTLMSKYGIDVISPQVFASADEDFSPPVPSPIEVTFDERILTSRQMTADDEASARVLIAAQGAPPSLTKVAFSRGTSRSPRTRVVVRDGSELIAFATWQINSNSGATRLYLFGNYEDDSVDLAIDHLLDLATRAVCEHAPAILTVKLGDRDVLIKERVLKAGFSQQDATGAFQKICLGEPVTASNWQRAAKTLQDRFGLLLPKDVPTFSETEARVSFSTSKGGRGQIKLKALENFLSPTVLALPERPAVIVPIWPSFAEALFRGSMQPDFLSGQRAQIVSDKCYLLDGAGIARIPEHGLIAFYESQGKSKARGRSAAIAIGRILRRYLASKEAALQLAQLRGVLSESEIKEKAGRGDLCVVEFDNLMLFREPVGLARLKEIGCADGAHLVTARALSNSALQNLLELGKPYAAANV